MSSRMALEKSFAMPTLNTFGGSCPYSHVGTP